MQAQKQRLLHSRCRCGCACVGVGVDVDVFFYKSAHLKAIAHVVFG